MKQRVAERGAHGGVARNPALLAVGALVLASSCGTDQLREVEEAYEIVGGQPRVEPSDPNIDRAPGDAKPSDFGSSAPVQVDAFVQTQVSKVDILWVIDNSGSMGSKQQKVKDNFQAFVAKLVENNSALDYHIGVVTTDTYNPAEAGRLQNRANLPRPWIGKDTCTGACDPVAMFALNSSVGITGNGDEKGLLAAMLALSPPLSTTGANAGFLRDDAALFIIVLSDEEDSSCSPTVNAFGGGCNEPVTFGKPDYYARFFEGLKGFGRKEFVTLGAIVATTGTTIPGESVRGCRAADNASEIAVYAPRYVSVANATGGIATSVCDRDYLPALQNLGFLATGAKSTFVLSRAPFADSLKVYVKKPGETTRTLQTLNTDYFYRPCVRNGSGGNTAAVLNAIEFNLQANALPPASSVIEIEYPVNVRGVTCP